uniref:UNC93-like protein MFSD11 n=1 Tax=Panagrolaimus sp. PS1159 TaxID=55785 RepID=A0AC35F696_9BILA
MPEPANGVGQPKKKPLKMIKSMFQLMFTKRMLCMAFVFAYVGVELSFWSGVYSTCISNTDKIGDNPKAIVALTAICEGLGLFTSGALIRIVSTKLKSIPKSMIVFAGMIIHLIVYTFIFLNLPNQSPLDKTPDHGIFKEPSVALVLICGYFLGFGDSCWNTQIYSFLIAEYPDKSAQAFSIYKFFHAMVTCAAFFWSKYIQLQWHFIILCATAIWGCFCFFVAESSEKTEFRKM